MSTTISKLPVSINALSSGAPVKKSAKDDPERVRDAATQFESLLLAQMLKSIHEAGSQGWLGAGEDQAGASAMDLAQEQFAQALAARGGLGLANFIVSGLQRAH